MGKYKAFTLVELLVVIAIIALLLTILLPAMSIAKKKATAVVCLANQHNLLIAWRMYADENNGRIVGASPGLTPQTPPWGFTGPGYSWACTSQTDSGVSVRPEDSTVEEKINGIRLGLLYEYLRSEKVYHCPGDTRYRETQTYYSGHTGMGAYRTYSIVGGLHGAALSKGYVISEMSQIRRPAGKYVFVEEADGRGENIGSWSLYLSAAGWTDPFAIWHRDSSTLGYADGHAILRLWRDQTTIDLAESQTFGAVPGPKEVTDLPFMRRGYPIKE
jgi:prepilin-type N-terminal cleavage/methylation domain-containing protein